VQHKRARLSGLRLTPAVLKRRLEETRRILQRDLARAGRALDARVNDQRRKLGHAADQLPKCARASIRNHRQSYAAVQARLSIEPAARRWQLAGDRLSAIDRRRDQALGGRLDRLRTRLSQAERLLATLQLSEQAILERGYALVLDSTGQLVRRAAEVKAGEALGLRFADGTAHVLATGGTVAGQKAAARPTGKPKAPEHKDAGKQGSLF
jgi:exodeoxyribonuclease VII large subunit